MNMLPYLSSSRLVLLTCFFFTGCGNGGETVQDDSGSGGADSSAGGSDTSSGGDSDGSGGENKNAGGTAATGGYAGNPGGADGSGGDGDPTGTGSFGNTASCDGDPCPEWGTCTDMVESNQCTRICSFDEAPNSADGPTHRMLTQEHVTELAALKCNIIDGPLEVAGTEIVDLAGLETIRTITEGLKVNGATELTSLQGLKNLEQVGLLTLDDCPKLTEINWGVLESLGDMSITSLPSLTTLNLPALQSADNVTINVNSELAEINMDELQAIAHDLIISSNSSLTTLHAFPSLEEVPRVHISINPKLPQCEVDAISVRVGGCDSCTGNDTAASCN